MRLWLLIILSGCSDAALDRLEHPDLPTAGGDTATQNNNGDDDTTGPATDTDPGAPQPNRVRFIAFGDGGEGNDTQYAVGAAVLNVCQSRGCDFAIYLGDNFYDDGVSRLDDEQFQGKFEQPYAALDFPFYVVLGNHDYGSTALEEWRGQYQVSYTDVSAKWTMPAKYYTFTASHAQFFGLDSNAIMMDWTKDEQGTWIESEMSRSTSAWRIAFGHHPYISNGHHGNAGSYENCSWCPVVNGRNVKSFMDDHICGKVDVYFCGHDHNRQWLQPVCGTEFIVSGAAAKTTALEHYDDQPTFYENDQVAGFMWVELLDDRFYGAFYDASGTLQYERSFQR
jgi:tartrate-resistant acid phosphatase type 5